MYSLSGVNNHRRHHLDNVLTSALVVLAFSVWVAGFASTTALRPWSWVVIAGLIISAVVLVWQASDWYRCRSPFDSVDELTCPACLARVCAHPAGEPHPPESVDGTALREQLAEIEHERWSDWQRHAHAQATVNEDGSLTLPAETVARWERQITTPYAELTPAEQDSDRAQVDRYWPLIWRLRHPDGPHPPATPE